MLLNKAGEVKLGGRPYRLGSALRGLTVGVQPEAVFTRMLDAALED